MQAAQVFHVGAAPGVDGLVVVADGGKHAFGAAEQAHEGVLAGVGVLAFVDEQVAQAVLPAQADVVGVAQQQGWQADEVVEVDGLVAVQGLRV